MTYPSDSARPHNLTLEQQGAFPWEEVRCPGLTAGAGKIRELLAQLPKRWAIYAYKSAAEALWVVFVGGTGTGKSTIFNAVCEKPVSQTGFERPKTFGPIVFAHENLPLDRGFPIASMSVKMQPFDNANTRPHAGEPQTLQIVQHQRQELAHLILVDTPDVDSLEARNRETVDDLYLLADVIVFVTSQEKYADEVPFQFLRRVHHDRKICFTLLNKGQDPLSAEELLASFSEQGVQLDARRTWLLPYLPASPSEQLRQNESFNSFLAALSDSLRKRNLAALLKAEKLRGREELNRELQLLMDLLAKERQAAKNWLEQLAALLQSVSSSLLEQQSAHFDEESREYLQEEIRRLFSKYDVLRKPRRLVAQVLLSPLQFLGLISTRPQKSHQEALLSIREKINLTPIRAAVERFNRSVLENLSPADPGSRFYQALRKPELIMTEEEIKAAVWEQQEKLASWLESTFQQMAEGIPKSKEWGIYSTSILWGALILSFEAAVGGGITLVEAVLDSAIAPFVTKGAVELFAYQELQKIARSLAKRYQEGLLAVLKQQQERYIDCLRSLSTSRQTLARLAALQNGLARS